MSSRTELEIGDLVRWVDPLMDLYDDPTEEAYMKVYGFVIGYIKYCQDLVPLGFMILLTKLWN